MVSMSDTNKLRESFELAAHTYQQACPVEKKNKRNNCV